MTLKMIQGFETCRDDTDFRAQGWIPSTIKMQALFPPSFSGTTGTSLRTPVYKTDATATVGTTACNDLGYYNSGVTVNQAYTAGGFTLGCAMEFNQSTAASFQPSASINAITLPNLAFDGTLYWTSDASFVIWTSPDLVNWTKLATQPAYAVANTSVSPVYLGNNVMAVVPTTSATSTNITVYWTNNSGSTWNTFVVATVGTAANFRTSIVATGNSSFPHAIVAHASVTGNLGGIFVGDITAAAGNMARVISFNTNAQNGSVIRLTAAGYLVTTQSAGTYGALASNSALNTPAAWTTGPAATTIMTDVNYINGTWVIAAGATIYYMVTNSPVPPASGTWSSYTTTSVLTNFFVTSLVVSNGIMYAFGYNSTTASAAASFMTSVNGTSWTAVQHVMPSTASSVTVAATGGAGLSWPVYTGSKWVMCGGITYKGFFSSLDLVNSWKTESMYDTNSELAVIATVGPLSVWSGTAISATGVITGVSSTYSATTTVSVATAGNRTIGLSAAAAAAPATTTIANTSPYHYYEMVFRPVAGTANLFTISLYVDQALITSKQAAMAATTDTTSFLIFALSSRGQVIGFDDIYFTVDDGAGVQGPLGVVNVAVLRPTTNVQAQWSGINTSLTNAQNVRQGGLSSNATMGVTSFTQGQQDIYSTTDRLPVNFKPLAVQFEGYASKVGIVSSASTLGIISSGHEADGASTLSTSTTPTFQSTVQQTDPNGSIAWTVASVNALQFTVKKG